MAMLLGIRSKGISKRQRLEVTSPLQDPNTDYNTYEARRCQKCRHMFFTPAVTSNMVCAACLAKFEYVKLPDGSWGWKPKLGV